MSTYTPLASYASLASTPLYDPTKNLTSTEQTNLMTRASRMVEAYCGRHLSQFTGLIETHRAENVDVDENMDTYTPLDQTGMLGMSRAQSLGASELVRHFWVREHPPLWQEYWTGSITSITIFRAISGSQIITDTSQFQYEPDTGHVRMNLGTYVPQGSTLQVVYSGGYSTVPEDLQLATLLQAELVALMYLDNEAKPDIDVDEIQKQIALILSPYVLDQ